MRFTLERTKKLGANVILLNEVADFRKQAVGHYIETDTYNHDETLDRLKAFLQHHPDVHLHGAITFGDDDVPLLARICDEFDLRGNSQEAAMRTRNKYEMRKRLGETGLGNPRFQLLKTKRDLQRAIESIGFPAVLKPAWGTDSEFVIMVTDPKEAETTFRYLLHNCNEQYNPIFKYNDGMFLYEEYMEGMEVSVECFSQYGIPHVVGINEKQPIKLPYFVEYGDIAPARLDEEDLQEVNKLAESALIALGVTESLAHIEIKITPTGPKIVEVASRMGGDDIYFNVRHVWDVDMIEIGLQIALGERVETKRKPVQDCVICRYFIPEHSGIVSTIQQNKELLENKDVIQLTLTKDVGDAVLVPPEGYQNAGWVIVRGKTYQQAETLLEQMMRSVDINVTKFHRDSSLGKTTRENALDTASILRTQIIEASRLAKLRSSDLQDVRLMRIGIFSNSDAGEAIHATLAERGYRVELIDVGELPLPIRKIQNGKFDFVLNLCETSPNTPFLSSHIAALMEMLQIPFSGSSAATMSMALDKITVKKLLDYHDIPTPPWDYIENLNDELSTELTYPLIIKPARADHSLGIRKRSVVKNERELRKQLAVIIEEMKQPALIEQYVEGDEIDVCILGNGDEAEVLPLIRSVFDQMPKGFWHIYSSDLFTEENAKVLNSIRLEKPARISPKLNKLVSEIALDMFSIFECRDYAEIELRVDQNGNPFVLELNPNPGILLTDFLPQAAELAGYDYGELLESIIWSAIERYRSSAPQEREASTEEASTKVDVVEVVPEQKIVK